MLRVDSPGGDALASDLMWRAIRRVRRTKPVIASFGDVSASGTPEFVRISAMDGGVSKWTAQSYQLVVSQPAAPAIYVWGATRPSLETTSATLGIVRQASVFCLAIASHAPPSCMQYVSRCRIGKTKQRLLHETASISTRTGTIAIVLAKHLEARGVQLNGISAEPRGRTSSCVCCYRPV